MREVITTSAAGIKHWDNGIRVSPDNAFTLGFGSTPHNYVAELERHARARSTSSRTRAQRVADGTDRSTIVGLSKRSVPYSAARRAEQMLKPRAGAITLSNSLQGQADAQKRDRTRRGGR